MQTELSIKAKYLIDNNILTALIFADLPGFQLPCNLTNKVLKEGPVLNVLLDIVYNTMHPQAAVGVYGFQIWREAAKVLRKQSRTTENGLSSGLGTPL